MITFKLVSKITDPIKLIDCERLLKGWHSLNYPLSENESISWCIKLIEYEQSHANRPFIIDRLRSRATKIASTEFKRWLDDKIFKTRITNADRKADRAKVMSKSK